MMTLHGPLSLIEIVLVIAAALAAYQVRAQSRLDAAILAFLAVYFAASFLLVAGVGRLGGYLSLFVMPTSGPALGLLMLMCFFFTPVRGWPRLVYLVAAGMFLFMILFIFALGAAFAFGANH